MAGPGDEQAAAAAGRGYLLASHADREQTIDVLKTAFAQGRLASHEFDARIGQALAARTYAHLAAVTADIPAQPAVATPPRRRTRVARWGASGAVTPVILAVAFTLLALPRAGEFAAEVFVVAFGYLVLWLCVGIEMLRQGRS